MIWEAGPPLPHLERRIITRRLNARQARQEARRRVSRGRVWMAGKPSHALAVFGRGVVSGSQKQNFSWLDTCPAEDMSASGHFRVEFC